MLSGHLGKAIMWLDLKTWVSVPGSQEDGWVQALTPQHHSRTLCFLPSLANTLTMGDLRIFCLPFPSAYFPVCPSEISLCPLSLSLPIPSGAQDHIFLGKGPKLKGLGCSGWASWGEVPSQCTGWLAVFSVTQSDHPGGRKVSHYGKLDIFIDIHCPIVGDK